MDGYFATEEDIMIDIEYENELDEFEYLHLTGIFINVSRLDVTLSFSICVSMYFSIIGIRKYVGKNPFIYNICNKSSWT